MTSGWYLMRTRAMSEYLAAAALERNGYEFFFPRVETPKPRPGYDDMPLFPGYVFVRCNVNGRGLPSIQHMAGLLGWVQFDGVAPSVPDRVIDDLQDRLAEINSTGGHWTRFQPGQTVRVASGHLQGLAEVLEEPKTPESRIRVLLEFMGRMVPARVPWHDLQPVAGDGWNGNRRRPPRRTRGRGRWIRGFGPRSQPRASTS